MKTRARVSAIAIMLASAAPMVALATDGYFSHGYGLKNKGMAGASVALAHDAFGGANNPASGVWAGARLDLGLDVFSPRRSVSRTGSGGGMLDFSVDSDSNYFFIPEVGYTAMLSRDLAWGVTVFGNGGMNTDYSGGQLNCAAFGGPPSANGLCGLGRLGVDLSQLMVAPNVSWRFAPGHSVGAAAVFAFQRFEMNGAHLFTQLSQSPGDVTNKGYDNSAGLGLRLGYQGKPTAALTLGASYQPKIRMGAFDKYKGLFAGNGDFDIPSNMTLGLAFQASPDLTVAVDWSRIRYSEIASVGNSSSNQAPLGAPNGPGFGWQDVDVWKVGFQYQSTPTLTWRAGYNRSDNPITSRDVSFNILAPGVVKDHVTVGFTYALDKNSEITGAYMHALANDVTGPSFFNAFAPGMGGSEKIEMYQNSLGIGWSKRF